MGGTGNDGLVGQLSHWILGEGSHHQYQSPRRFSFLRPLFLSLSAARLTVNSEQSAADLHFCIRVVASSSSRRFSLSHCSASRTLLRSLSFNSCRLVSADFAVSPSHSTTLTLVVLPSGRA